MPPDIHSFEEWNLGPQVQGAIAEMGITVPTPIQKLAIGPVLEGSDVIAKAETGTGKTLAFGAPMMAKIDPARASVLGLVLCPTRELAEQVSKVLAKLGEARGIRVALIVGGEPLGPQVALLKAGSQVVVGTPGRVLDLYNQKFLSFPWTEFVVLDEADVMLEIGFIDDVRMILSFTPDERQTLLFSATFPTELLRLARASTREPVEVATASGISTVDTIDQSWMKVEEEDRPLALTRLIEQSADDDVLLVFCDRRTEVDRLMRRLERLPYSLKALHGGYDQEARFRVMTAFRTGEVKALVATDVASRGLDVAHVTHVVNYGSPHDLTDYTHRIGRTGRAGRKGRAITLVTPLGMRKWTRILADASWKIAEIDPPLSSRGHFDSSRGSSDSGRARSDSRRPRSDSQRTHSDSRRAPADSHRAPADAQSAPADSHRAPADSHRAPADSHRAPADSHRAPADSRRAPADSHRTRAEPRHPRGRADAEPSRSGARSHERPQERDASRAPAREHPPATPRARTSEGTHDRGRGRRESPPEVRSPEVRSSEVRSPRARSDDQSREHRRPPGARGRGSKPAS